MSSAPGGEAGAWTCPRCDGSGWVLDANEEAQECTCRAIRVKRARSVGVSSVIPIRYRGVSFDRFPVPELAEVNPDVVRDVKRFCESIDSRLRAGDGFWLTGDIGTGKSTLAMLISKRALDDGHTVAIYSIPKLLARIRDTYGDAGERSYQDFVDRLTSVDLLHLEDLGAEKQTEWVLEQLYSLINARYEEQRSILITTNLNPEQLKDQVGERTVSRLIEMCGDPIGLYGEDQRVANLERLYARTHSALG